MSVSATAAAPIPLDSLAWNSSSNHYERSTLSHGKVPGFFQSYASQTGRGGWAEKACLRLVILMVALRPSNYLLALVIVSMNK